MSVLKYIGLYKYLQSYLSISAKYQFSKVLKYM